MMLMISPLIYYIVYCSSLGQGHYHWTLDRLERIVYAYTCTRTVCQALYASKFKFKLYHIMTVEIAADSYGIGGGGP